MDTMNKNKFLNFQMMQLLKIQINLNNLYRHTLLYVTFCYIAFAVVYFSFAYYFFLTGTGKEIRYIASFILSNGAFALIVIQFQVVTYSMYLRFSVLNGFVE